ncbi:PstS family phosphate ABC transporter substrate-binding protein [Stappia taiwanensis]|uniref:PstS family phosphate ABC transporter substrate-binding protein n=2 Tax=Stappia taiwanensis TaxID=992267 RepID=A0A838XNX7_9HYPH|nr:PstS family phosphate ABC transporter substrate-binding protein [Stappia taiwanensis]MBA4612195.1 PstS family phosphate ABC transporter substrate-binding protein [Stappia taiwanensis]
MSATALAVATTVFAGGAMARDQIQIVGSSTVFPFSTAVAEQFGQKTSFKTPVVESTGSGGGMKLFCAGVGEGTPDMTNASRRIKKSEFETCTANGVTPVEVKIGFDGIVLANSKAGATFNLTLAQVFLALAKEVPVDGKLVANPYVNWSDIDPSLPTSKIEVLGPPPTSGTRDAFVEIAMEGGCKAVPGAKDLGLKKKKCHEIREDGAFIEAGENDNLIVQKLEANPNAVGIFGFSFLDQNADKIQGSQIGGVEPTFENIAAGDYPVSRSLYFYIKKEHVGVIPGIEEYAAEFTADGTWGDEGYLSEKGLIPLPAADREKIGADVKAMTPLSM